MGDLEALNRDITGGFVAEAMTAQGHYRRELSVYGYVWSTKQGLQLVIGRNEDQATKSYWHLRQQREAVSAFLTEKRYLAVRDADLERVYQQMALELRCRLMREFNEAYFAALETLMRTPDDDQALSLLLDCQHNWANTPEKWILLPGLARMAYMRFHLTYSAYVALQRGSLIPVPAHSALGGRLTAFAWMKQGAGWQCVADWWPTKIYRQMHQLSAEGAAVTPLIEQKYADSDVQRERAKATLLKQLSRWLQEDYGDAWKAIRRLPPVVEPPFFQKHCGALSAELSETAYQTLREYGFWMGIWPQQAQ